jgi:threonine dehydrogenase-like Zn-dependent dehydrogenase
MAAKAAGADCILISGLQRDKARLKVARDLGADHTIDIENDSLEDCVRAATKGRGVDLSIDTAGGNGTLVSAIRLTRKGGTLMFAAAPEQTPPEFCLRDLVAGRLTLRPCRGHSFQAVELALRYIASGRFPLELIATHRFGLKDVDLAVRSVGGHGAPGAIHVTVLPWE